jgi:hypothetical protein
VNAAGWWALLGLASGVLAVVWLTIAGLAVVTYLLGCWWLERRERRWRRHVDQALTVAGESRVAGRRLWVVRR